MASTERIFFAGVATSAVLIGAGFGGGLILGKTALGPIPQTKMDQTKLADKPIPPARVVLPALTTAATNLPAPAQPVQAPISAVEPQAMPQPDPPKAVDAQKQHLEKEPQADRKAEAEKEHAERAARQKKAAERARHRLFAEKRAR